MKRLLSLLFFIVCTLLEANALRVRTDRVTYEVDLTAHTAEMIELDKDFS